MAMPCLSCRTTSPWISSRTRQLWFPHTFMTIVHKVPTGSVCLACTYMPLILISKRSASISMSLLFTLSLTSVKKMVREQTLLSLFSLIVFILLIDKGQVLTQPVNVDKKGFPILCFLQCSISFPQYLPVSYPHH